MNYAVAFGESIIEFDLILWSNTPNEGSGTRAMVHSSRTGGNSRERPVQLGYYQMVVPDENPRGLPGITYDADRTGRAI